MGGDRVPGFSTLALHAGTAGAEPGDALTLLEERVAVLEGGTAAVAVASGLAAQLAAWLVLLRPGDELIAAKGLAGGTATQLDRMAAGFGWKVLWADPEEQGAFERAVSPKTKALFAAMLADDGSAVCDVGALAHIAKRAQVPLIVDNTLATPFLAKPIDHGADIVIHSAEAFLGGEGGVIVDAGRFNWMREGRYPAFREPQPDQGGSGLGEAFGNFAFAVASRQTAERDLGARLTPAAATAMLGGLETLALRMRRHADNAVAVAEHLAGHRAVDWVSYPGLPGDRRYNLAQRYCAGGAGAVLGVGIAGGGEGVERFLSRTRLIAAGSHPGGNRTIALRAPSPDGTDHAATGGLQLFIGLEDARDLLADLDEALAG